MHFKTTCLTCSRILSKISLSRLLTSVSSFHTENQIRVRFAPSPTGYLHLGGLRTALYNFLFARSSKNGKFILRIEDTDQTRLVKGAVEQMHDDLAWAGIVPDEGPLTGGPFGPYLQSQRLDHYRLAADTLVKNGAAYHCFCTPHRLEILRRDALRRRQVPRYDNRCRSIPAEEAQANIDAGVEHCVRLKLIPECDTFEDLVCGKITHNVAAVEGDPVILKSDGFPTYHLANVVDDHLMEVSHVLRGIEWQASTPKHLMMYKGFGWTPPEFAHLPLLLNSDGSKLSKRQQDVTVDHYKSSHVLPRALVNFVTFSGGGFHFSNTESVRSLSLDELASKFDLQNIGTASCRVSLDRLKDFNQCELVRQMSNEDEMAALVKELRILVINTYRLNSLELSDKYIESVLMWSQKRISYISQLILPEFSFLWVHPLSIQLDKKQADLARDIYAELKQGEDFTQKALSSLLHDFAKRTSVKTKELMHLIRLILCGRTEGPAVAEVLEVLGQENSLARIKAALDSHHTQNTTVSK